jgi:hypothetical protein
MITSRTGEKYGGMRWLPRLPSFVRAGPLHNGNRLRCITRVKERNMRAAKALGIKFSESIFLRG